MKVLIIIFALVLVSCSAPRGNCWRIDMGMVGCADAGVDYFYQSGGSWYARCLSGKRIKLVSA